MPTVNMTISDTSQSVFRPTVLDVIEQMKAYTKIDANVPVFIVNDSDQLQSAGGTIDDKGSRDARMDSIRRVLIRPEETFAEDQHITDIYGKKNAIPVFADRALGVEVRPLYATSTVTLNIKFETRSKEEAHRWRNDASMKYIQSRTSWLHTIKYCYSLPPPVWELIHELWSKREAVAGYGVTLKEYLRQCTTNALTLIGGIAAKNIQLAVSESQSRIQGMFDFTTDPEKPEFDQQKGKWTVSFRYIYTYQRPMGVDLQYPVMVHNQLLGTEFIEFIDKAPSYEDNVVQRDQFLWSVEDLESIEATKSIKPRYPYIRIPAVDDSIITGTFPGTGSFLLVLLSMESADEKIAFNLANMGDVEIDHDVLDFIRQGEYKYIGVPGKSIFYTELYRSGGPLTPTSASIDKDLNVILHKEIDLRKVYHIRLSIFTDLSMIDRAALERLRSNPKVFVKVIGALNDLLRFQPEFQNLGDQRHIHPWQLTRVWEILTGAPITNGYQSPRGGYPSNPGNTWNGKSLFLQGIPESQVKWWRANRKSHVTVQNMFVSTSYERLMQTQPKQSS